MVLLIIMRAILLTCVCVYKVCNNAWYIINNLSLSILEGLLNIGTIVFRPGLVQGLGPGLWPSRPGQFFFFLNQNDVVLVKKKNKNQRVATGFLIGSCRVNLVISGFSFPYFFSTRPGSSPGLTGSRVNPSGRTGFQNYDRNMITIYIFINI